MSEHQRESPVDVLIVSEHEEFAAAASQQLTADDYVVRTQSPSEAPEALCPEGFSPVVALVDCDAKTADGSPLHQTIRDSSSGCQIVLICTLEEATTGAGLLRSGDVFDYVLTDATQDAHRLPLLVERASAKPSMGQHDSAAQYERVLQALEEMRQVVKHDHSNPIAKLLGGLKFDTSSEPLDRDLLEESAAGYEDCLPEFIAGRLRRLENQILLWGGQRPRAGASSPRNHVLVVEDDTISGELVQHILERHGFKVVVAGSAVAAREALSKRPPDLVLMDIHLGDVSGIQLIKRLRAGNICPNVPVIVTTSDRMRGTLQDAVDVKVQGYLLKPYEPALLVQKVRAVLGTPKPEPVEIVG